MTSGRFSSAEWRTILETRSRVDALETAVRALTQQIDALMEDAAARTGKPASNRIGALLVFDALDRKYKLTADERRTLREIAGSLHDGAQA